MEKNDSDIAKLESMNSYSDSELAKSYWKFGIYSTPDHAIPDA